MNQPMHVSMLYLVLIELIHIYSQIIKYTKKCEIYVLHFLLDQGDPHLKFLLPMQALSIHPSQQMV